MLKRPAERMKQQSVVVAAVFLMCLACAPATNREATDSFSPEEQQPSGPPPTRAVPKPATPNYRLTQGDIKGLRIPWEARLVIEDRAPASLGVNQEIYSVPWTSDKIISFFDTNMPREGFIKQKCGEFLGVPQCLYKRGRQLVGVEYEHGRFTLTEIIQ